MKKLFFTVLILPAFVFGLMMATDLHEAMAKGGSQPAHRGLATKYERMALAQEKITAEHIAMKEEYKARAESLSEKSRKEVVQEMEERCDAIVEASQRLAEEYRSSSRLHRRLSAIP